MIDKATAIPEILRRVGALPQGHALDLRSYKRDRSVLVVRIGPDSFEVRENGFHAETFHTSLKGLRKLLKTLLKREFPRSNKLRVYALGAWTGRMPDRGKI